MAEARRRYTLICGPMATLSHEAFRRMIEKFGGCDEYFTEMINAGSLLTRGPFEKYYLMNDAAPEKMVWQLTGGKTPLMIEAASFLAQLGGIGIDLNMGCCAPEIVSSGAGIAWMLKPVEETMAMVRGVRQAIDKSFISGKSVPCSNDADGGVFCHSGSMNGKKIRLSVKLRLGDENFTDESFFSFCKMLSDEGVEQITLHPRTRKQKYSRPAKWGYVQRLSEIMKERGVRVILNGDVKDVDSALHAVQSAPDCDGIMIARAACQKPWIFSKIADALNGSNCACLPLTDTEGNPAAFGRNLSLSNASEARKIVDKTIDLYQLVCEYLDDLQIYQPKEFWKTRLQRFFAYFCTNFSFAHYFQTLMLNARNNDDARNRIKFYFFRCPSDKIKLFGI